MVAVSGATIATTPRRIPETSAEPDAMPYLIDTLKLTALIVGPALPLLMLLYLPTKRD